MTDGQAAVDVAQGAVITDRPFLFLCKEDRPVAIGMPVQSSAGFTLPTVKRFSPTSGIGKPAVNRRKPLETARNDNSNSKNQ